MTCVVVTKPLVTADGLKRAASKKIGVQLWDWGVFAQPQPHSAVKPFDGCLVPVAKSRPHRPVHTSRKSSLVLGAIPSPSSAPCTPRPGPCRRCAPAAAPGRTRRPRCGCETPAPACVGSSTQASTRVRICVSKSARPRLQLLDGCRRLPRLEGLGSAPPARHGPTPRAPGKRTHTQAQAVEESASRVRRPTRAPQTH